MCVRVVVCGAVYVCFVSVDRRRGSHQVFYSEFLVRFETSTLGIRFSSLSVVKIGLRSFKSILFFGCLPMPAWAVLEASVAFAKSIWW